ncbi:hypothetical protein I553_6570 [Mycobacterium xenopi 4042]|uniref:Uncharacterized protein n=1 Tax=Mycobacterium xenopi 4042 TaxID=1299334 RepID=X8BI20_MYCXE|nr:hypothetical protein I553_6570 [Mycobacterium xenopi 4042]
MIHSGRLRSSCATKLYVQANSGQSRQPLPARTTCPGTASADAGSIRMRFAPVGENKNLAADNSSRPR